jgi:hypothetical protein
MGFRGFFLWDKTAGAWRSSLTSIYCWGQIMRGTIPPLPNTPSWPGAQKKYRDNFTFTLTLEAFYNFWGNFYVKDYKIVSTPHEGFPGTLTEENIQNSCMKSWSKKYLVINLPWLTYLSVP